MMWIANIKSSIKDRGSTALKNCFHCLHCSHHSHFLHCLHYSLIIYTVYPVYSAHTVFSAYTVIKTPLEQKGSYAYTYNMAIKLYSLLSKKQERGEWWCGVDTSYTVMAIKAPAVLKIETFIISLCEFRKVEHTFAMLGPQKRWWKLWSSVSPFTIELLFNENRILIVSQTHDIPILFFFSDRPEVRIEQIHLTSEQGRKEFWIR